MSYLDYFTKEEILEDYFERMNNHFHERHEYTEDEWDKELENILREGQDKLKEFGFLKSPIPYETYVKNKLEGDGRWLII